MRNDNSVITVPKKQIPYPSSKEFMQTIWLNNMSATVWKIKITLSRRMHEYIKQLHKLYPHTEWLGLCKTQQIAPWHFLVIDMIHPEQKIASADVTATDEGMEWAFNYLTQNDPTGIADWNCVLHSHHKMWVFWSGTDDNARKGLNDWRTMAFAIVTAYSGNTISYKGCLNFYRPFPVEIDAEMDVESSPEIENPDKTEQFNQIQSGMNYSLMEEMLGTEMANTLKEYYNSILHEKYIQFASDEITVEKVLSSDKYDWFLSEEEVEEYKKLREEMKEKQTQLKNNIKKDTPYTYQYTGSPTPYTQSALVSVDDLWSDYEIKHWGKSLSVDESYSYLKGMKIAPEYLPVIPKTVL